MTVFLVVVLVTGMGASFISGFFFGKDWKRK